jgi:hypothetical protein
MKPIALVTLLLSLSYPRGALAQTQPADPFRASPAAAPAPGAVDMASLPKTVVLTYQTFALPTAKAHALMLEHKAQDELLTAVQAEYAARNATLEQLTVIRTKSGQRAKVEEINEYPYFTDIDPPQIAQTLHLGPMGEPSAKKKPKAPDTATKAAPSSTDNAPAPLTTGDPAPAPAAANAPKKQAPPLNSGIGNITNMTPTAFEVRNIGHTLEVEPVIGVDMQTVDLTLAPESIKLVGSIPLGQGLTKPVFRTQKFGTSTTLISGHSMFLGTQSPPIKTGAPGANEVEQVCLSFVTPTITFLAPPPKAVATTNGGQLHFRWENFSLPSRDAYALLQAGHLDASLYAKITPMVKADIATLESVVSLITKSGQRSKVELIEEYSYPTDFDPPQIPQKLTITDPHLLNLLVRQGGKVGTRAADLPDSNLGFGLMSGTTPTTFETRNLGVTMEIDPVMGEDGHTVDFNVAPEYVRFVGQVTAAETTQPIFETQKLATAGTMGVGIPYFLGTMSRPVKSGAAGGNQDDLVWLAFLTAVRP